MTKLTGKNLAEFVRTKVGTPYVYGAKGADGPLTQSRLDWLAKTYPNYFTKTYLNKIENKRLVGKVCCDCSGLISWYTDKLLGSSQLYSQAKTRIPINQWELFPIGTVMWKQGHVGVYIGEGLVCEEKGINYGCVITKIESVKWQYGLLFDWMEYEINSLINNTTSKAKNPYVAPKSNIVIKKGNKNDYVKWLQFELNEAGYHITIDGNFGDKTYKALVLFQTSCKLKPDGICGTATKNSLVCNNGNPYKTPIVNVKKGSNGTHVKWVQYELRRLGYTTVEIDGNFGIKSETALKDFQNRHNLKPDGICGKDTRKVLKEVDV